MLHTNANYTCLGNANLFTLHFSQITANSPSQFRKGFAGPDFWRRKSRLAAIAGVRRDLGKKPVFLFPPASLDQMLVGEGCFPACKEEREERKEFEVFLQLRTGNK